jgi:hypothetical protein
MRVFSSAIYGGDMSRQKKFTRVSSHKDLCKAVVSMALPITYCWLFIIVQILGVSCAPGQDDGSDTLALALLKAFVSSLEAGEFIGRAKKGYTTSG